MPGFTKGGTALTPFGRNEILRSIRGIKTESYTVCAVTVPSKTIDGVAGMKILQPGAVMAKITSTPVGGVAGDVGKIGPFQAGVTDGRQTLVNIVGINFTFLPWQFMDRDVEVSVIYDGSLIQAWCLELDATPNWIALTNTTAAQMLAQKTMDIRFR
jgi:hypothetical protein